ncbi:hypothetical protein BDW59DRAFT_160941 [Aspergillus cavernicola]|uniref:CsbD-like domain-containing protein n=1 Tax=Aspergillus cavernicola TaxID=176166 RepID=A0ABR4IF98_9EURO
MEKQPTDYKAPIPATEATGARIDAPSSDGLDQDRAYDSGFKYNIPEGAHNDKPPRYQPAETAGVGDDRQQPTPQKKGENIGDQVGSGVRSIFAGIHGAGEWLRGSINAAVDRTFGSEEGATRNDAISKAGQEEIRSGRFTQSTQTGPGVWDKRRPN